jgi:hypothetical protein
VAADGPSSKGLLFDEELLEELGKGRRQPAGDAQ